MSCIVKFGDSLINSRFKDCLPESTCSMFVGDRGSGKSTGMAVASKVFSEKGYRVFCQYPYVNAYRIPLIEKKIGGVSKMVVDKNWLYTADLSHSLVIIDEARTVWNSRSYSSWTESDEEFFNFIRKTDTYLILGTQRYDALDLNIRFATDYSFFFQRSRFFRNLSSVDISRTVQVKIADKQTQIVSRGYAKNAMKVVWDIAEIPICYTHFYRKPYYNDFDTLHTTSNKKIIVPELWNDILAQNPVEVNLDI